MSAGPGISGPGQHTMMAGPMRPTMNMGGMGPGQQTIMTNQMPNGPNTMVRAVSGPMVGPGAMPNMIRQQGGMVTGPRMMGTNVRMAIRVSDS